MRRLSSLIHPGSSPGLYPKPSISHSRPERKWNHDESWVCHCHYTLTLKLSTTTMRHIIEKRFFHHEREEIAPNELELLFMIWRMIDSRHHKIDYCVSHWDCLNVSNTIHIAHLHAISFTFMFGIILCWLAGLRSHRKPQNTSRTSDRTHSDTRIRSASGGTRVQVFVEE